MASKKQLKSKEKADTPRSGSVSAAPIRSRNLSNAIKREETIKPPMKYNTRQLVSIDRKHFDQTNGIIIGYEWGEGCRPAGYPKEWVYWVADPNRTVQHYVPIPESEIHGRISA